MIKNNLTSWIVWLLISCSLHANQGSFFFSHITVKDGLSQSTVFSIKQDHVGYMWFGTSDGLNKYDGYNFTVYNNNPSDSTSISGNSITEILEDKNNIIWVGTVEGILNKFNRQTETFSQFIFEIPTKRLEAFDIVFFDLPLVYSRYNNRTITSIIEGEEDILWIGTWGNGLIEFHKKTGKFTHYLSDQDESLSISSNRITSLTKDHKGNLWIGTFGGGLNKLVEIEDTLSGRRYSFVKYKKQESKPGSLSDNKVISLYADRNNSLWVGTYQGGLDFLASAETGKESEDAVFINYHHDENDPTSINSNFVTSIIEDRFGAIWAGTFGNGLNQFVSKGEYFIHLVNDPYEENSLSDNDVLALFVDNSGVLWIGTHLGVGISKLERNTIKFGLLNSSARSDVKLNDDVVWSILEDSEENLWIGTYRGGINKINLAKNTVEYYSHTGKGTNTVCDNHIRAFCEDSFGNIWIGTYSGGLCRYNKAKNNFTVFKTDAGNKNSIGADQIQSIFIDENNICWIGTFGGGLNYFDLKKYYDKNEIIFNRYMHDSNDPLSVSDNRVYTIYPDGKDILWLGTYGGGLNKFDKNTGIFTTFKKDPLDPNSLSENKVISIFKDSNNDYWIGTFGGGLNKFNANTEKFERYGDTKGFTTQVIYGILEDDKKNLWFSSDNGIVKYNLNTLNITYYNLDDGLQSMEFSGGAYFKNKKGEMFFGGIGGLNYFYPDSVKSNDNIPPIVISEFRIFNQVVKGEFDRIAVSYDQNFITIEFAALDYTDPQSNQYAYYLEGLENTWNFTDAKLRKAFYTNLEPGTYIFRAKGSNNDGVWNQEGLALTVEILPPFWKTWWFILINIVVMGSIVSFLISMKVKHLLAIEKLKVRLAADLHDNVGAGLTEISILSQLASNEIKPFSLSAADKLETVTSTARHLVDSMSDIVWFINPNRDSLHDLIIRLKDSYSDLLSEIGISFGTNNIENISDIKLPMDMRQNLFLIFKEGINNAIKHSRCNKINLETDLKGNTLHITLKDNGVGLNVEQQYTGNGLNNMKERAKNFGGILEIVSGPDEGTSISFIGKIEKPGAFKFIWS